MRRALSYFPLYISNETTNRTGSSPRSVHLIRSVNPNLPTTYLPDAGSGFRRAKDGFLEVPWKLEL